MLDALKFVQGAVARKDFVPALQHFRIRRGKILSFNGSLAMCSPIPLDLDVAPRADLFIKAIEACTESAALHLSDKGKLVVRSGKFKTFVDCVDSAAFPEVAPTGERVTLTDDFLPALRYLEGSIASDASRPWACGILLDRQSAFATNNVIVQEFWLGFTFPARVNLPVAAVRELLRIGEAPIALQMDDARVTFHFAGDRWLASQVLSAEWPDAQAILTRESEQVPFPAGFFEALEQLLPFSDDLGRCYFLGDRISTSPDPDLSGTSVEVAGLPIAGSYNLRQLLRLRDVATTIDFSSYPQPSMFYGGAARGLISGLRT